MSFEKALLTAQRTPSEGFSRVILRVVGLEPAQKFNEKTAYSWRTHLNAYSGIQQRTNVTLGGMRTDMLIDTIHFKTDPVTALVRTVAATDEAMLDAKGLEPFVLTEARQSSEVLDASSPLAWYTMDSLEDTDVSQDALDIYKRHRLCIIDLASSEKISV
jgi:hypothetical protein